MSDMDYCSLIEERLRCTSPDSMISDCASHFGMYDVYREARYIGIPNFAVTYNRRYQEIASPLIHLILLLKDGDRYREVRWSRVNRVFHPYGLEQVAEDDNGIRMVCRSIFRDTNDILVSFHIESYSKLLANVIIAGRFTDKIESRLDRLHDRLLFTLKTPRTDQRDPLEYFYIKYSLQPSFQYRTISKDVEEYGMENSFSYAISSGNIDVDRNHASQLRLSFSIGDFQPTRFIPSRYASIKGEAIDYERSRWNAILSKAPHPPTDNRERLKLYYHAYQVLLNNLYAPIGLYDDCYACFPNKGYYDAHWLWDSAFHMLGFMKLDSKLALDILRVLFINQEEDGRIPHFVCVTWKRPGGISQPPILSWACWLYYLDTMDDTFLKEAYDKLRKSNEWWFKYRDPDGDGLCVYHDGLESGWDNSPRWDKGRVEAVDLNSFLLLETRILAKMAEKLGLNDDVEYFRSRGRLIEDGILKTLYDDEDNIFYDVYPETHEYSRVLTLACFIPLWVGVGISGNKARSMIEEYLLNPKHFYGEIPLPIVAYSDPAYEHNNFWRGPVWYNIAYIILQVLWRYGYREEASAIAEKLLRIAEKQPYIYEYYDSKTGEGLGAKSYGWTAATIIELTLKNYQINLNI